MEFEDKGQGQAIDPSGTTAAETALATNTILCEIFRNLSAKEVLELSLVNKKWNYEARCVLRDQKKCVAFLKGPETCAKAKLLNDQMGRMNVVFFNGLSVQVSHSEKDCSEELKGQKIEDVYDNLLLMPLKYLEINWWGQEQCIVGQLVLRFIKRSLTLQYLHVRNLPQDVKLEKRNSPTEEHGLPKLKILEIPNGFEEEVLKTNLLAQIIPLAPNLEDLKFTLHPELVPFMPRGSVQLVKSMWFGSHVDDPKFIGYMQEIAQAKPQLQSVHIEKPRFLNSDEQVLSFFQSLGLIVYYSRSTLESVTIDVVTFEMLSKFAQVFAPLENVKELEFWVLQGENVGIRQYLLPVPCQQIFPSVRKVSFSESAYARRAQPEESLLRNTWPAVHEVELKSYMLSESSIVDLRMLFWNLRHLKAAPSFNNEKGVPFQLIWRTWPLLESLEVGEGIFKFEIKWDENLDGTFCGIHPDEANLLREHDEEFLRNVNIVPAFPAIYHHESLRKMKILLETESVLPQQKGKSVPKGGLFLSKVTGILALQRMPQLELELDVPHEAAEYLDHLKPYVKLIIRKPDPRRIVNVNDPSIFERLDLSGFFQQLEVAMGGNEEGAAFGWGWDM